jgi:DNA-binding transcriptional LysR family regulator
MDEAQIRTALEVNRTGSFTRAAQGLHVTQSTVTARIQQLERELNMVIWERSRRRLALTPEGQELMRLFARVDILLARIHDTARAGEPGRPVVVGSVHSQWSNGVLPILHEWSSSTPAVRWRLITGHSGELLQGVADGSLDLVVTYFPGAERGLRSVLLAHQKIGLLGKSGMMPPGRTVASGDLAHMPLAYVDWGPPFTDWFRQELAGRDGPQVQVDQAPLLLEILRQGLHVGFMPRALAEPFISNGELDDLPYQPLTAIPARAVYAVSSDRSLARQTVRTLWDHLTRRGADALGHET